MSKFAYKEGFSSQMVKTFIKAYSKKNGKILDPFSGSGTTLFAAAQRLSRQEIAIGDINEEVSQNV